MTLHRFALTAVIGLACCTTAPLTSASTLATQKVITVCALYERSYRATKAASLPAPLDIVIGCPGRTSLKSELSRFERVAALRRATEAPLPATVGDSDVGRRLFQRMISRGVPVDVATRMTTTPEFARALAARV